MGWTPRAGLAVLLALAAGCASAAPAPPAEVPVPAEAAAPPPAPAAEPAPPAPAEPLAVLALDPGTEHLFRQEMRFEVNPPGKAGGGVLRFRIESDLRFTIVSADGKGGAEVASALERVAGSIDLPGMGMHMAFDSRDPPADDSPMSPMYSGLFAAIGKRTLLRIRRGEFPVVAEAPPAPAEGAPEEGAAGMFPMGEMSLFAWLDLLPAGGVRAGGRSPVTMNSWGGLFGGVRDHDPAVEVRAYDPATGIAEFAVEVAPDLLADHPAKAGAPGFVPKRMRFVDRFDLARGRYLSRSMEVTADVGSMEEFALLSGEEGLELAVTLTLDRVDAFPPPAAPAPAAPGK